MYAFPLGLILLGLALFLLVLIVRFCIQVTEKTDDTLLVFVPVFGGVLLIVLLKLSLGLMYTSGYHDAVQDIQEHGRAVITDTLYVARP